MTFFFLVSPLYERKFNYKIGLSSHSIYARYTDYKSILRLRDTIYIKQLVLYEYLLYGSFLPLSLMLVLHDLSIEIKIKRKIQRVSCS